MKTSLYPLNHVRLLYMRNIKVSECCSLADPLIGIYKPTVLFVQTYHTAPKRYKLIKTKAIHFKSQRIRFVLISGTMSLVN